VPAQRSQHARHFQSFGMVAEKCKIHEWPVTSSWIS
jgi:hypothetical protein